MKKHLKALLKKNLRHLPASQLACRNELAADFEWPLFERMRLAAQDNPLLSKTDGHAWRAPLHSRLQQRISEAEFTQFKLQQLIAAAPPDGVDILLPPGRLFLSEPLYLKDRVRLCGTAGMTELIFQDTDCGIVCQGSADHPLHGVELAQLRIRHDGPHHFSGAVFATHAHELHFSDLEIIAPRAVGMLLSDGVKQSRFERCRVVAAGLAGFTLIRDVSDCVFNACAAEQCLQSGIFLTDLKLPDGMDALDFTAQLIHTNQVIGNFGPFAPEDPAPRRIDLLNCVFRGNRKMGITTDGVGELRVINCVIAENDCEGITLDNGTWRCLVQQCHIYANGWRGRQDAEELGVDFVQEMGLLEDGSSKAKLPGVSFDNAAWCRVENNLIEGNWGDGVKFVRATYACTVAANSIAHNNRGANERFHFFGVLIGTAARQHPEQSDFPSCYNRVFDNDIVGAHHAGIHLLADTHHNQVEGNRIIAAHCLPIEDHSPAAAANEVRDNVAER